MGKIYLLPYQNIISSKGQPSSRPPTYLEVYEHLLLSLIAHTSCLNYFFVFAKYETLKPLKWLNFET